MDNYQATEKDRKAYAGRVAPAYLSSLIERVGGTNIYGEPNFRLVWAPHRLTPSGGTWVDWDKGSSVRDRKIGRARPVRKVSEVRMIRRYGPAVGWLLEKWCPPSLYGSPRRWYSPAIMGGTMILVDGGMRRLPSQGSFPTRGDYEYTGFTFSQDEMSEASVLTCVQGILRGVEELPTSPYARLWQRTIVAEQAQRAVDENYEKWALGVVEDAQPAFKGQPMAGYGKKGISSTENVARRLGFKEHV